MGDRMLVENAMKRFCLTERRDSSFASVIPLDRTMDNERPEGMTWREVQERRIRTSVQEGMLWW